MSSGLRRTCLLPLPLPQSSESPRLLSSGTAPLPNTNNLVFTAVNKKGSLRIRVFHLSGPTLSQHVLHHHQIAWGNEETSCAGRANEQAAGRRTPLTLTYLGAPQVEDYTDQIAQRYL